MAAKKVNLSRQKGSVTVGTGVKPYDGPSVMKYPPGLTKEVAKNIVRLIKLGATPRAACVASGVGMAKFERWYTRGQLMDDKVSKEQTSTEVLPDEDLVCLHFYRMVLNAVAKAAVWCSAKLRKNPDWRAHSWRMERIYSKFLDADQPKLKRLDADGKPIEDEGSAKVIVYIPDNGRSTVKETKK